MLGALNRDNSFIFILNSNLFDLLLLNLFFTPFLTIPFTRIEFARGMLANKEDWNKLVMAAKMVSDPNIQVNT